MTHNMFRQFNIIRIVRFSLASSVATLSHWSVMAIMVLSGVAADISTGTGALLGAIINYLLQRKITFFTRTHHATVLPLYIAFCIFSWLGNLSIFIILHNTLLLSALIAQLITTLFLAYLSYFFYKRIFINEQCSQPVH